MSEQKRNFCTHYVVNLDFSMNSMNNLLSHCRFTDAGMRASEKDLPAQNRCLAINIYTYNGL